MKKKNTKSLVKKLNKTPQKSKAPLSPTLPTTPKLNTKGKRQKDSPIM